MQTPPLLLTFFRMSFCFRYLFFFDSFFFFSHLLPPFPINIHFLTVCKTISSIQQHGIKSCFNPGFVDLLISRLSLSLHLSIDPSRLFLSSLFSSFRDRTRLFIFRSHKKRVPSSRFFFIASFSSQHPSPLTDGNHFFPYSSQVPSRRKNKLLSIYPMTSYPFSFTFASNLALPPSFNYFTPSVPFSPRFR